LEYKGSSEILSSRRINRTYVAGFSPRSLSRYRPLYLPNGEIFYFSHLFKDYVVTIALYADAFYNVTTNVPKQNEFFVFLGSSSNSKPTDPLYNLPDLDQAHILPFRLREGILYFIQMIQNPIVTFQVSEDGLLFMFPFLLLNLYFIALFSLFVSFCIYLKFNQFIQEDSLQCWGQWLNFFLYLNKFTFSRWMLKISLRITVYLQFSSIFLVFTFH
jgi:hypothetical protein